MKTIKIKKRPYNPDNTYIMLITGSGSGKKMH